jgi:hypothetical protein
MEMIELSYRGPVRGAHYLAGDLEKAGAEVDWKPPQASPEQLSGNPYIVAMIVTYGPDVAAAVHAAVQRVRDLAGDAATIDERIV